MNYILYHIIIKIYKRYDIYLSVPTKDTVKFNKEIGFIYCVNKNYKLNVIRLIYDFHSIYPTHSKITSWL